MLNCDDEANQLRAFVSTPPVCQFPLPLALAVIARVVFEQFEAAVSARFFEIQRLSGVENMFPSHSSETMTGVDPGR